MNESASGLGQMSTALQLGLVVVLVIATALFYSASRKFLRYFRGQRRAGSDQGPDEDSGRG